jgi:hypothetical protein
MVHLPHVKTPTMSDNVRSATTDGKTDANDNRRGGRQEKLTEFHEDVLAVIESHLLEIRTHKDLVR